MELKELIERVKSATGLDRELDEDIRIHFDPVGSVFYSESKAYTGSIDAAIALVERCLPGWDYSIENMHEDGCYGKVWKNGWHDDTFVAEVAPTAPLAITLALLTALDQKEENK